MTHTPVQNVQRPVTTRIHILDRAEEVFAERGYCGASMAEIAVRAEVPKSLIHHHFGGKPPLWREVCRRCLDGYRETWEQASARHSDFGPLIRGAFAALTSHRNWVRILGWLELEANAEMLRTEQGILELLVQTLRAAPGQAHQDDGTLLDLAAVVSNAIKGRLRLDEQLAQTLFGPRSGSTQTPMLGLLETLVPAPAVPATSPEPRFDTAPLRRTSTGN